MNLQEAMQQLQEMGTAQNRKVYARHGVSENMFGVSFANQNKLAKAIKRDQGLSSRTLELPATTMPGCWPPWWVTPAQADDRVAGVLGQRPGQLRYHRRLFRLSSARRPWLSIRRRNG